jgi:hypothetical protein
MILPGPFMEGGEANTDTANGTERFYYFVAHDGACVNYVFENGSVMCLMFDGNGTKTG